MTFEMMIALGTLAGAALLFITGWLRNDLVGILVILMLMLSGILTVPEALAGFSDPVIMIIAAMFIVSEALTHTGIAQTIGATVLNIGGNGETRIMLLLMLAVVSVGSFMSSTAALAIFIPVTLTIAEKANLNRKRLLMPLSVGALISGMTTLVATTPNLIVSEALSTRGLKSFGFFSFAPFGAVALIMAMLFMAFAGRQMLSIQLQGNEKQKGQTFRDMLASYNLLGMANRLRIPANSPLIGRKVSDSELCYANGFLIVAIRKASSGRPTHLHGNPDRVFAADDELLVLGERKKLDQMVAEKTVDRISLANPKRQQEYIDKIGLAEIMLAPNSKLIGKTLEENQFYSQFKSMVVAVRRRGEVITEGLGTLTLDFGDVLLITTGWEHILALKNDHDNFVVLKLPQEVHELVPGRNRATYTVTILAAMVFVMAAGLLPTVQAAMLASLLLIIGKSIKMEKLYTAINWPALILIAGLLPLATALNKTGLTHLASEELVRVLGPLGPVAMLVVIFLVTALTGLFISNTATAVLISPVAVDAALTIGASPQAFAMTVAIACSAAFVTPISTPGNMLVLEPGGYRFVDFVKVGSPLLLLTMIVTVAMAKLLYM